MPTAPKAMPCALAIGGLDPGGGAGIAADLRAFAAAGAFGCAAAAVLTVQSTAGLRRVREVPARELSRAGGRGDASISVCCPSRWVRSEAARTCAPSRSSSRGTADVPVVVDTPIAGHAGQGAPAGSGGARGLEASAPAASDARDRERRRSPRAARRARALRRRGPRRRARARGAGTARRAGQGRPPDGRERDRRARHRGRGHRASRAPARDRADARDRMHLRVAHRRPPRGPERARRRPRRPRRRHPLGQARAPRRPRAYRRCRQGSPRDRLLVRSCTRR